MCSCGKRCRRGRPNCRVSRKPPCHCDGYHYPHRAGSKLCAHSPASHEARNLILYGPS